jgi:hypothetical protein
MRRIDPQNPPLELFAGARSYKSAETVTAVRLTEPVLIESLLGNERGDPGDYLCRDRKTGRAWIVGKGLFEATYFVARELDGSTRNSVKGMVIR